MDINPMDNIKNNFFKSKIPNEDKIKYIDDNYDKINDNNNDDIISKMQSSDINPPRYRAEGSVNTVEEFAKLIKTLLEVTNKNITFKSSDDFTPVKDDCFPIITYNTNNRKFSKYTGIKPKAMSEVVVKDNEYYLKYTMLFDCTIEFDFYGNNSYETSKLMIEFEKLMITYAHYFKKKGVSELYFLKEIPSKTSVNYVQDIPMRCDIWYVRLENSWLVKQQILDSVMVQVNKSLVSKIE